MARKRKLNIEVAIDSRNALSGGTAVQGALGGVGKAAGVAAVALSTAAVAVGAFAAAGRELGEFIGHASREFASFDQQLRNVGAVSGATREEIAALSEEALRLAKATRFSPEETAGALYSLASSGQAAAEQLASLPAVLDFAEAAQADLGLSTELVVRNLKSFNLEATEARRVADVLTASIGASALNADRLSYGMAQAGPAASVLGQTLETTVAAVALLVDRMGSGEMAGAGLKQSLLTLMSQADDLGIQVQDSSGKFRDLVEIIRDLEDAGTQGERILAELGTRAGPAMSILVSQGADALEAMRDRVTSTGQAAEVAGEQLDTLQGDMDIWLSAQDEFWKRTGAQFEEGSRRLFRGMSSALGQLTEAVEGHSDTIGATWSGMVEAMIGSSEYLMLVLARLTDRVESTGLKIEHVITGIVAAIPGMDIAALFLNQVTDDLYGDKFGDFAGPREKAVREYFAEIREAMELPEAEQAARQLHPLLQALDDLDVAHDAADGLSQLGVAFGNLEDISELNRLLGVLDVALLEAEGGANQLTAAQQALQDSARDLRQTMELEIRQTRERATATLNGSEALAEVVRQQTAYNRVLAAGIDPASATGKALLEIALNAERATEHLDELTEAMRTNAALQERVFAARSTLFTEEVSEARSPTTGDLPLDDFSEVLKSINAAMDEVVETEIPRMDRAYQESYGKIQAITDRAWENIQDTAAGAISEILRTGELDFQALADSILNIFANMLADLLIQWAANAAKRVAIDQAAAAASASSSATLSTTSGYESFFGGGGSAAGGISSTAVAAGAVVAIVAAVGYALGWWGGGQAKKGSGTFGGADPDEWTAMGDNAVFIARRFREASKIFKETVAELDLEVTRLGEVTLNKVGTNYNIGGAALSVLGIENTAEAIAEAVVVLALRGAEFGDSVSSWVAAIIHGSEAVTKAALQADVEFARMVEAFGKSDLSQAVERIGPEMGAIFDRVVELIGDNVAELSFGLNQTVNEEIRRWSATRRQITGEQLDPAEQLQLLRAQAEIWNAEKALRIANLQAQKLALEGEKNLEITRIRIGREGFGARRRLVENELELTRAHVSAQSAVLGAAATALDVTLRAIETLIEALEALPDIDLSKISLPRTGGVAGPTEQDRDVIRQEVAGWGLHDVAARLREARTHVDSFAERIAEMGFSAEETAELIGKAREEQARLATEIYRDVQRQAMDFYRGAIGIGQIVSVRVQAEDLREAIEALGLSAANAEHFLSRIDLAEALQLERIEAGIAGKLFDYLEGAEGFESQILEYKRAQVELEFAIIRAQLEALGVFAQYAEIFGAALDAARAQADEIRPPVRQVARSLSSARSDAERIAESFQRAKSDVAEFLNRVLTGEVGGGVSPITSVTEAMRQFDEVLRQARTGNIGAIGSFDEYGASLLRLAEQAYASGPEFQAIRDYVLAAGAELLSLRTGREGNLVFDERFHATSESQLSEQRRMVELLDRIERHLRGSGEIVQRRRVG